MRAIGTIKASFISKYNRITNLVLNVQSISENPQKLPSLTIDSILIYLTKVRRLSYYTIPILKRCYDYFLIRSLKPFQGMEEAKSINAIITIFDAKLAFSSLRIVNKTLTDLTRYRYCDM
ncbi:hypothetical protein C7B69_22700 [filamentous cyanobacterium Phorm 46]|nr:hypothetical protein C7B69_22700 [filamentous cyanobacterium Phorm 46]